MRIEYKKRKSTDNIVILIKDTCCLTYDAYFTKCRRKGDFDVGVQYFVDGLGVIHDGRLNDEVASWEYPDNSTSLYILAQSNSKKLNSCQKCTLTTLVDNLKKIYGEEVNVVERVE